MSIARRVDRPTTWPEFHNACIMLVDDDVDSAHVMARALRRAGCTEIATAHSGEEAMVIYRETSPDLVVMDLNLPREDGLLLMDLFRALDVPSAVEVPVLMVTDDRSEASRRQALERGVSDFLNKDADTTEFVLRVRNLLHLSGLRREIQRHRESLETTVQQRTLELEAARHEVLERLAVAAEYRDDATLRHTRRVGYLSSRIAGSMHLPPEFVHQIQDAALLHDLGKIGIPDAILLKPGPLTPEEFERVKAHPEIGARILDGCSEPLMVMAREIALTHHERWDGTGYPRGLAEDGIPLSGRIVAVADAFDTITHARPYKPARPVEVAIEAILADSGSHFDPTVVQALVSLPGPAAEVI